MKVIKISEYVKKNTLSCVTAMLSIIMFCTLAFVAYGKISEQSKNKKSENARTVILDAGHGGEDGGAVGVDGIIEKDINLSVALKLRGLLEASGYNVIMTRDKDEAIYDDTAETLREKKRSDLHNRADMINDNSKDNTIFVSIHQNKFPDSKYFGTQIFYSKNNSESQGLASGIKDSVVSLIQPDNTREIKPAEKNVFLLHKAQIPAVVVECGFLSNREEAQKLVKSEYQSQLAFCVYCGIINYFLNKS